jgi:hypothetical protein
MALMADDKPGPTGDYPQGKFDDSDEGGLQLAVSHQITGKHRVVRIDFGKPTIWYAMDADTALAFASLIVKHATALKE